jgi:CheY-like chemotaxis protein
MEGVSIFLVEDEALIRMMVTEMLEELGHRVVAEAGSIQAAEPLAYTFTFGLAIFDINVGGLIALAGRPNEVKISAVSVSRSAADCFATDACAPGRARGGRHPA